ncbi:hypothetical protein SDC9_82818 [bioreactor metagenome]|uniref:Uncharacterized protein n=1 Tax=bioreactor metagenome TaxID=1076179 RepID=A0A644ZBX9_9ZZZZ
MKTTINLSSLSPPDPFGKKKVQCNGFLEKVFFRLPLGLDCPWPARIQALEFAMALAAKRDIIQNDYASDFLDGFYMFLMTSSPNPEQLTFWAASSFIR